MSLYDVPCAVTADLNRYLAKLDEDEGRDESIDERTEELLAGDYAPFTADNLAEALGEIDIEGIAKQLADGKEAEAGTALAKLVREYWDASARLEAERQINDEIANACPRCRGRGCRHCDEDYGRDD
jgi:hypothetical protein